MGLQSNLSDVSSDSIPLLLLALIANGVRCLRSLFFTLIQSLRLSRLDSDEVHAGAFDTLGSGLAGLVVLAEQLNLNRIFSHRFPEDGCGGGGGSGSSNFGSDCVVCMCGLRDGDQVRRLPCRHVFHKDCFDGWLDHLNFTCPLCRSPLVSDDRVLAVERRVAGDIVRWFSVR